MTKRFILSTLLKGPLTREEVLDRAHRFGSLFGIHPLLTGTPKHSRRQQETNEDLSQLLDQGLMAVNEQSAYYLTEQGIEKAKKLSQGPQKFIEVLVNFLSSGKTARPFQIR